MKIIVTGHASGIGYHISNKLHTLGHSIIGIDINNNSSLDDDILQIKCDLLNEMEANDAFSNIDDFDVCINCAGKSGERIRIDEFDLSTYMESFNSVFIPLFNSLRNEILISKKIKRINKRKIINISSITSKFGCNNMSAYSSAKAAITNLTKVAAMENRMELIVNSVSPATIDTPMIRKKYISKGMPDYSNSYPVGDCGSVEDVFIAVKMLMDNNFITGYDLEVDGGYSSLFELR